MNEQYMWVISRRKISYLKQAFIHNKLLAKTWVVERWRKIVLDMLTLRRDTNTIIAKIKTTWYLLDSKTKRPRRIDADLM
ncbi:MAG: acyl-CoA thioesterase, partial [Bacteroidetes bacterium]|nr:acyl-CoA thioesterase [Bacteroidota bacterium]